MKAWLRFFRAVNLPTVPGDVWVGAVAAWFGADIICDYGAPLFNATIAGILLYMFGLADNDIVGATTDKGRPIPGGQISMRAARIARAAMANWGIPPSFAMPYLTIAKGAVGAVVFALVVAVPTAFGIISKNEGVA